VKTHLLVQLGIALAVGVFPINVHAQSQRDMVCQGSCGGGCGPCPTTASPNSSSPTTLNPALGNAAQSIGNALGQQLGKAIFGGNKAANQPIQPLIDPAQQQREFAAQQLDNSGLYLLKQRTHAGTMGAINEFQKALANTPNDGNILHHLAMAQQQLKDLAAATQTSGTLGSLLNPAPAGTDQHSSVASPNASALSLVNLDPNVVDLRGTTNAAPASLKSQLDGIFAKTPVSAPPASPVNRIDAKPAPDPDAMMKKIFDLNDKSE
jgi:hypothetical protein